MQAVQFICVALYLLCIIGLMLYGKWIFVIFSILSGDKETIHEYGNLCDKEILPPWDKIPPPRNFKR